MSKTSQSNLITNRGCLLSRTYLQIACPLFCGRAALYLIYYIATNLRKQVLISLTYSSGETPNDLSTLGTISAKSGAAT